MVVVVVVVVAVVVVVVVVVVAVVVCVCVRAWGAGGGRHMLTFYRTDAKRPCHILVIFPSAAKHLQRAHDRHFAREGLDSGHGNSDCGSRVLVFCSASPQACIVNNCARRFLANLPRIFERGGCRAGRKGTAACTRMPGSGLRQKRVGTTLRTWAAERRRGVPMEQGTNEGVTAKKSSNSHVS